MYGTSIGQAKAQAHEEGMEGKRKRSANWTDSETLALLQAMCEESPDVLFSKFKTTVTNKKKNQAYLRISTQVAACGVFSRDVDSCKDKWSALKQRMNKRKHAEKKTGGGGPMKAEPFDEVIRHLMGEETAVIDGLQDPMGFSDSYTAGKERRAPPATVSAQINVQPSMDIENDSLDESVLAQAPSGHSTPMHPRFVKMTAPIKASGKQTGRNLEQALQSMQQGHVHPSSDQHWAVRSPVQTGDCQDNSMNRTHIINQAASTSVPLSLLPVLAREDAQTAVTTYHVPPDQSDRGFILEEEPRYEEMQPSTSDEVQPLSPSLPVLQRQLVRGKALVRVPGLSSRQQSMSAVEHTLCRSTPPVPGTTQQRSASDVRGLPHPRSALGDSRGIAQQRKAPGNVQGLPPSGPGTFKERIRLRATRKGVTSHDNQSAENDIFDSYLRSKIASNKKNIELMTSQMVINDSLAEYWQSEVFANKRKVELMDSKIQINRAKLELVQLQVEKIKREKMQDKQQ